MLRDRLRKRIRETENRTYLPMTVDQMRMLKAITTSTLHVIRTANKTLSLQKAEAVDKIANEAAAEVRQSKGNDGKLRSALTRYNLTCWGWPCVPDAGRLRKEQPDGEAGHHAE